MIYLAPEQLREVEFLIGQSKSGIHHLFDASDIKVAFAQECNIDSEDVDEIKDLFYEFISQKTLDAKRTFYRMLDQTQKTIVIRTYFNVVENELCVSQTFLM